MTPIEYAVRGRWILWGAASVHMYRELTDDEGDYLADALAIAGWGFATGALIVPQLLETIIGWSATRATQAALPIIGRAGMFLSPFAAGYLIGATVGTVVAKQVWGDEGAQTALGFYSGGLLPGTDAPNLSDYQYIFKPSEPGGPMSLYDLGEIAVKVTLLTLRQQRNRIISRHPSNPYLI